MTIPTRRADRLAALAGPRRRPRRHGPETGGRSTIRPFEPPTRPPESEPDPSRMDLIDISRSVAPSTAVWPGDQSVTHSWTSRLEAGGSVNLSALSLSLHTGTHVDAPYHVAEEGRTTDALPLSAFVGPCVVVDTSGASTIRPEHLPARPHAKRVLFKTRASDVPDEEWPSEIVPVASKTAQALTTREAVLLGTDNPSVDPEDSTELDAHHALRRAGIVHLEGLSLSGVEPGQYQLLALPLKIPDADAAPVRAVLAPAV